MADDSTEYIPLQQSQATNGYTADGNAVGIPTYDEYNNPTNYRINPESGELYDPNAVVTQTPGSGANDDAGRTTAPTQQATASVQTSDIQPQPNILDSYASYTYSISWFLLDPLVYKGLRSFSSNVQFKNKLLQNAQLLVRSGGLPRELKPQDTQFQTIFSQPNSLFSTSPQFNLDFYIDNLELNSTLWGKGSRAAHNVFEMKFTITEPYGITLIPRLYQAVYNFYTQKGIINGQKKPNYAAAQYGLLISFYGYDDSGNLVRANNINRNLSDYQVVDSLAVVEKFYPFIINEIKFRVANKTTEYSINATPLPYSIGSKQSRNTIPLSVSLTGQTVQDILVGRTQTQTPTAETDGRQTTVEPTTSESPLP